MPIQSIEHSLSDLFSYGLYKIPNYQRRYCWGEKENEDLFNDLWEGFVNKHSHWLGTVSVAEWPTDSEYNGCPIYIIIDGQQRFTSLMILYSVLINYDEEDEYELDTISQNGVFALEPLSEEDGVYFSAVLSTKEIPEPQSKSQHLMMEARKLYTEAIARKMNAIGNKYTVGDFIKYINENANFLIHLVSAEASIEIFRTINDRGLPLKYFDKIKALFMQYSAKFVHELDEQVEKTFDKIYEFMDHKFFDDNIWPYTDDDSLITRHYLSNPELFNGNWSHNDNSVAEAYNSIKSSMARNVYNFIQQYCKDISAFIDAVYRVDEKMKEYEQYFEFYSLFKLPPLLYSFSIRLEILGQLENNINNLIAIAFYLIYARRNPVKRPISTTLMDIMEDKTSSERIKKHTKKLATNICTNDKGWDEILSKNENVKKYALYVLSREKYKQPIEHEEYKTLLLDHICPIEASSVRQMGWGAKETYLNNVNFIGNCLLIERKIHNSKIVKSDDSLPLNKIPEYNKSKYQMNHNVFKNVLDESDNTKSKDDMVGREKELEKFIKEYLKNEQI